MDDLIILEDEKRRKEHFGTEPSVWPAPSHITCPAGIDPGDVIFIWQFLKYFGHLFTSVKIKSFSQLMKLFTDHPTEKLAKKIDTLHCDIAWVNKIKY